MDKTEVTSELNSMNTLEIWDNSKKSQKTNDDILDFNWSHRHWFINRV